MTADNTPGGLTFECTLEEFKQAVAEFCKAAPTCDLDSLDNGLKAVGLMYFGIKETRPVDLLLASGYVEYAQRQHMKRLVEIVRGSP